KLDEKRISIDLKVAREKAFHFIGSLEKDGRFPYCQGKGESTEATSWAAIALASDKDVRARVIDYLLSTQKSDGGWSTAPADGKSDWTTSLCVLALRIL